MTPKMMVHAQTVSAWPRAIGTSSMQPALDFATIGHMPLQLSLSARCTMSCELEVIKTASDLLVAALPDASSLEDTCMPSLLCGFEATVPSADNARVCHRATRNVDVPQLGLKCLSLGTQGLMTEAVEEDVESKEDIVVMA
jgi:hypothetical protein